MNIHKYNVNLSKITPSNVRFGCNTFFYNLTTFLQVLHSKFNQSVQNKYIKENCGQNQSFNNAT